MVRVGAGVAVHQIARWSETPDQAFDPRHAEFDSVISLLRAETWHRCRPGTVPEVIPHVAEKPLHQLPFPRLDERTIGLGFEMVQVVGDALLLSCDPLLVFADNFDCAFQCLCGVERWITACSVAAV